MAIASRTRFRFGSTAWVLIVTVLLVVIAAMVMYFR
jgi:hypothetical protein